MHILCKTDRSLLPLVNQLSDLLFDFHLAVFPLMPPYGQSAEDDRARLELVRHALSIVIIPRRPLLGIVLGQYNPYYRSATVLSDGNVEAFSKYCNEEVLCMLNRILELDRQIRAAIAEHSLKG